ncbi:MAG: AmmeMemoRadiSam system protein B [Acidimicrobiia bacterium]
MTSTARVRPAAFAGAFYAAAPEQLAADVDALLATARATNDAPVPKALVVPHAGYIYSGPVAAAGYARLAPGRGRIERVVLLGPAHRVVVRGLAVGSADAFATPLGELAVDTATRDGLVALPFVSLNDPAHGPEHSLEVHLPFIQRVLGDVQLVPVVVGDATPKEVVAVLDRVWGGPETVIIVSSDLSHFLDDRAARVADRRTADAILARDPAALGSHDACGAYPLRGLLRTARDRGMDVELVALANSADTAGTRERVVGYGAFALSEPLGTTPS